MDVLEEAHCSSASRRGVPIRHSSSEIYTTFLPFLIHTSVVVLVGAKCTIYCNSTMHGMISITSRKLQHTKSQVVLDTDASCSVTVLDLPVLADLKNNSR